VQQRNFPDEWKQSEGAIMDDLPEKPALPAVKRVPRKLAAVETPVPVEAAPAAIDTPEPDDTPEPEIAVTPVQPPTSKASPMTAPPTFKGYEEIAAFGKANVDALLQANSVFTAGFEAISKEVVSLTQSQFESAAAGAKAIFAARTLKDFIELNAGFTKSHFDKLVANSTRLGELSAKVATDTFAPIGARVTSVVEKAAKPPA
jgi:phasin family protein